MNFILKLDCSKYNIGSGKTTLAQKAGDVLQKSGITVQGFYTEEVRQHGKRTGFDVVTFDGTRSALARVGWVLLKFFFALCVNQEVASLLIRLLKFSIITN